MQYRSFLIVAAALALVAGCDEQPAAPAAPDVAGVESSPALAASTNRDDALDGVPSAASPREALDLINDRLAAAGSPIAVSKLEYVTGGEADEAGQTVFATDRTLRLTSKWVAGDARRLATGDLITQTTFAPFGTANVGTADEIDGIPPINASFGTWDAVTCSNLDLLTLAPTEMNPSAILIVDGEPGDPFQADISTFGFLPGDIFDLVFGPGASDMILGVTFTFIFIEGPGGPPTDINGDGLADTALKEVWYNDNFLWSTSEAPGSVDIETVALHENGHALELGHFGRVAVGDANGKLHISPRAVMNAFIFGTLRDPLGTDNGAYCGNWDEWPNS